MESFPPLLQLYYHITQNMNRVLTLANCPINHQELTLLREIVRANGQSQTEISKHLGRDRNNLSSLFTSLEKKSLIARKVRKDDHRCYVVQITSKGSKILEHAEGALTFHRRYCTSQYGKEDWQRFNEMAMSLLEKNLECYNLSDDEFVPEHCRMSLF